MNPIIIVVCISFFNNNVLASENSDNVKEVDNTAVTDEETYPYMVAILRKTTFVSAGALINEKWVLTAADAFYFIREAVRILRARLDSTNYKHSGILTAIKYIEIHPNFDDSNPEFDIALIRLSEAVKLTPNLNPIKLQTKPRNITATYFTVTGWETPTLENSLNKASKESLQQRQLLFVSYLHPIERNDCLDELEMLDVNNNDTLMCLESAVTSDPCQRDIGAAVVLNGVLWGIVSSWKREDCDVEER